IQSLDIHIFIESADDFNIPRIAQMTQKTNQFNLTTKRYSESDIRSGIHSGWQVFCMSVSDRFGDNGITGCIIINGRFIDSFLLSCRVLGKNIEFAIMKSILSLLKRKGVQSINAQFSPTVKNKQVEDFYDKCGFSLVNKDSSGAKLYKIDLTNADLTVKPFYHIVFKNE
ncbi:MAG: hypothetical protein IJ701_04935, partial [Bacteroidales bacterium]|nr:hypothetical protein [Bacteroidales bacterium]